MADYLEKLKEEYPGMFGPVGAAPAIASHEFAPIRTAGLWSDYVRPALEWVGETVPGIGRSETSDPSWRAPVLDRRKEEREAAEEYRRRSEEDMRKLEEETREYEETFKKIGFITGEDPSAAYDVSTEAWKESVREDPSGIAVMPSPLDSDYTKFRDGRILPFLDMPILRPDEMTDDEIDELIEDELDLSKDDPLLSGYTFDPERYGEHHFGVSADTAVYAGGLADEMTDTDRTEVKHFLDLYGSEASDFSGFDPTRFHPTGFFGPSHIAEEWSEWKKELGAYSAYHKAKDIAAKKLAEEKETAAYWEKHDREVEEYKAEKLAYDLAEIEEKRAAELLLDPIDRGKPGWVRDEDWAEGREARLAFGKDAYLASLRGEPLPTLVDPTFEAAPSTHYSDPLKHWDTETVPGHLPLDITDTPFYSAVMGEEHKYFPEDVAPVTPVDDFSSMPLDAATRTMIDADMEAGIHPAVASLSPVSLPSGGAFTSSSMAPDIGLEPGGMAGPGSGTDPTTHGVGPAIYGTGTWGGKMKAGLGGLTSDIGTGETYGPAFVDTYSDMMAGKPSSGVDTSHTGSYYAAGTSPVDAATRLTGPEFGDLFSDREISIDSPALTSSLASIAASPVSAVPGPYGVSSTSVVPSGWITPDIDPETERMLTGRVHAIAPEDISVTHSPHATIATVSEPTAKYVGGTTTMTVRDVMPAPVSVPASLVAEVLAPTPHLDSRTLGRMSGRELAAYEALIDAFERGGDVGPGESALSAEYGGLGYGGGSSGDMWT